MHGYDVPLIHHAQRWVTQMTRSWLIMTSAKDALLIMGWRRWGGGDHFLGNKHADDASLIDHAHGRECFVDRGLVGVGVGLISFLFFLLTGACRWCDCEIDSWLIMRKEKDALLIINWIFQLIAIYHIDMRKDWKNIVAGKKTVRTLNKLNEILYMTNFGSISERYSNLLTCATPTWANIENHLHANQTPRQDMTAKRSKHWSFKRISK